jgi:hypothetical protein
MINPSHRFPTEFNNSGLRARSYVLVFVFINLRSNHLINGKISTLVLDTIRIFWPLYVVQVQVLRISFINLQIID